MNDAERKRRETNLKKFGVENVFQSEAVKKKIKETCLAKYGVDHPMKSDVIRAKQFASSQGKTSIEEKVDLLTRDNVVFTGYGGRVVTTKRAIHKGGKRVTKICPDFMVFADMDKHEAIALSELSMPIRGMSSRYVIELFGDYYHSESIIGVPEDIHEKEVIDAYRSAGIECLVIWERDIVNSWDEVCQSLDEWISKAVEYQNKGSFRTIETDNHEVLKCLVSPEYWRSLPANEQDGIIDTLCLTYKGIDFPTPNEYEAKEDFNKFQKWAKTATVSGRPTRFGLNCCRSFVLSMSHAYVKGMPSMYDIWNDEKLMRECIRWQWKNENGRHNARRFLSAMCFKVGFRTISNLHPSKVFQWVKKNFNYESGDIFFDPCAGWGGRMIASHCLGLKYVGIDANVTLVDELTRMAICLGIDAEIHHGDSSDENFIKKVMRGRRASVVFSSPPYFDKEIYCEDGLQSIKQFPDIDDWNSRFFAEMSRVSLSIVKKDSFVLFNMDMDFNMCCLYSKGWNVKVEEILLENSRKKHTERLIFISSGNDSLIEKDDYLICRECGAKCQSVTEHVRKSHGMSKEEYVEKYPDLPMVSMGLSEKKVNSLSKAKRGQYKAKSFYRCPDGRIVRKVDAWKRAWGLENPPSESILTEIPEGVKGVDYVECLICGHRGQNLTRHIKSHGVSLDDYKGVVKSENCKAAFSKASNATWDARGRKELRDKSQNKTHKVNALDKDTMFRLYVEEGLSDVKIGRLFDMTGEGVSYRRRKYGIATRSRKRK